jgi:hypothetical protein
MMRLSWVLEEQAYEQPSDSLKLDLIPPVSRSSFLLEVIQSPLRAESMLPLGSE